MIFAAATLGLVVALANTSLAAARKLPTTGIGSGGYGDYIWSAITGLYAAGLALGVLPLVPGVVAAVLAIGLAATFVFGRSVWVIAALATAAILILGCGAVSLLSRWLTAGLVFAVVIAALLLVAVPKLGADPGFAERLPALVRSPFGRPLWVGTLAGALAAAAALPAEQSGVLLMTAAVTAAASLAATARFLPWPFIAAAAAVAGAPALLVAIERSRDDNAWLVLPIAVVAMAAGVAISVKIVFREIFGPFQPEFRGPRAHPDEIRWVWIGAVTEEAATVVVRPSDPAMVGSLEVTVLDAPDAAITGERVDGVAARFRLRGLASGTSHRVRITAPEGVESHVSFRTFGGRDDEPIRIAIGSCASTGSNGAVFGRIADHEPHLFCQLGDLHYENIDADSVEPYRKAFDAALSTPAMTQLMSQVPVAYVYDDHDFGKNNSNRTSKSIPTVWENYGQLVPHYELGTADGPVYSRFRVGPVLVVISDTRAERDPTWKEGNMAAGDRRLIGPDQERWLVDAPRIARDLGCQVVLWCSPTPWLGLDRADVDTWTGYPEQRRRIANALSAAEAQHRVRIVVVSGDAHMIGLDSGTADRSRLPVSETADAKTMGGEDPDRWQGRIFPAMNAASLDRRGSHKGAHYDEFEQIGAGQFGILTVDRRDRVANVVHLDVYDQHGHRHGIEVPLPGVDPSGPHALG